MKSPMIESLYADDPEELARYTDMQVCVSAAGFYVGTMYHDPKVALGVVPGSRDSFNYYPTQVQAAIALLGIEGGLLETRMEP